MSQSLNSHRCRCGKCVERMLSFETAQDMFHQLGSALAKRSAAYSAGRLDFFDCHHGVGRMVGCNQHPVADYK